jgi:glycerol-3-phosphate acyltransferase PlsY
MLSLGIIVILSYLVGSIPTGIIVGWNFKGIDVRNHGSGNIGSTNVFRVLGWKYGLMVQVVDMLKGVFAAVLIARLQFGAFPLDNPTPFDDFTVVQIIAGVAAVLGHVWTIFAGFRGGKGVNTAAGMLIGIAPIDVSVSIVVFVIVLIASGYVSLGSISAAITFPTTLFVRANIFQVDIQSYNTLIVFSIAVSLLLIYTHRSNIKRLLLGTESRFARFMFFARK